MEFPNREQALKFFNDVKVAVEVYPDSFTNPGLVFRFSEEMLTIIHGEWKTITQVPEPYYEINRDGVIRHKVTKEVIEPQLVPQYGRAMSTIRVSGENFYFHGPELAAKLYVQWTQLFGSAYAVMQSESTMLLGVHMVLENTALACMTAAAAQGLS